MMCGNKKFDSSRMHNERLKLRVRKKILRNHIDYEKIVSRLMHFTFFIPLFFFLLLDSSCTFFITALCAYDAYNKIYRVVQNTQQNAT